MDKKILKCLESWKKTRLRFFSSKSSENASNHERDYCKFSPKSEEKRIRLNFFIAINTDESLAILKHFHSSLYLMSNLICLGLVFVVKELLNFFLQKYLIS